MTSLMVVKKGAEGSLLFGRVSRFKTHNRYQI